MITNEKVVPFSARRSVACAIYQDKIYFFGGVGAEGTESILDVSNDLWSYAPTTGKWESLHPQGETPASRRCIGFASSKKGIHLWGGSGLKNDPSGKLTYSFLNDLWLYLPEQDQWQLIEAGEDHTQSPLDAPLQNRPEPRYTPAWHPLLGTSFALFSGYTEDRLGKRKMNDLWLSSGEPYQWKKISYDHLQHGYDKSSQWPGLRYGAISAANASSMYIFGGFSDIGDHNDIWVWDSLNDKWECLFAESQDASSPAPRYCAAGEYYDGGFWVFGGRSRRFPKMNFNDTWRFDLKDWHWEQVVPQSSVHDYSLNARTIGYHAKSASSVFDGSWYILGGEGLHGHVSDFWCFNFKLGKWNMVLPSRGDDPIFW